MHNAEILCRYHSRMKHETFSPIKTDYKIYNAPSFYVNTSVILKILLFNNIICTQKIISEIGILKLVNIKKIKKSY